MKNLNTIFVLFLFVISFSSCVEEVMLPTASFTAVVDGENWVPTESSFNHGSGVQMTGGGISVVGGTNIEGLSIYINHDSFGLETGVIDIDDKDFRPSIGMDIDNQDYINLETGFYMEITFVDNELNIYSGTMQDSLENLFTKEKILVKTEFTNVQF